MRLLIDLQGCQNGSRHRGIGRYSLALCKGLLRQAGEHRVVVLLNGLFHDTVEPLRQELSALIDPSQLLVLELPGPVDELKPENAWRRHAATVLREAAIADLQPDAVLVSSMVEGAMDDTVASVGWVDGPWLTAAVLYDLIPLMDPDRYIGWAPARAWYMDKMQSLQRCDLLLSISSSAKGEAEQYLGVPAETVVNISTAADNSFVDVAIPDADMAAVRKRLGIDRPYLMHSGSIEPRKNFHGLVKAFAVLPAKLRRQHQLVLAGKVSSDGRTELERLAQSCGLAPDDVVITGYVSDPDLMALYAGCHLFVFASLHEGFGLPALEAMHFGVPTIGSNTSSIPEVIGLEEATFDPTSTSTMAAAIERALLDTAYRERLKTHARQQASRFSWDACAQTAWRALEARIAQRPELDRPARAALERQLIQQIATPQPDASAPTDTDLLKAAQCWAANERAVNRLKAHAAWDRQLSWRIEGPFDSSYSLALVNRECARGLEALGHRVAMHSTEGPGDFPANPHFLTTAPDIATMHARVESMPHADCDVVSRNLYPPRVSGMGARANLLHPYAWEETGFPPEWVDQFNEHLQGVTCLSDHVRRVLLDNGVRVPLATAGCGVDHWERIEAKRDISWPGRRFRFLHVSSCFPRKGADAMLEAFASAFSAADDVSLLIKTFPNPHNTIGQQVAAMRASRPDAPDVQVIERDMSEAELKGLYLHCHVLVAPSRAEGFGLPIAEAMLSGLPVITTGWGPQTEFCSETFAWLVDYRFTRTASHFDLAASAWADPDVASLGQAMRQAFQASPADRARRASAGRAVLLEHHRWIDVAARAVTAVRGWSDRSSAPEQPRTGWVTTWNTKCGIASYSEYLLAAAQTRVTVLAPRDIGLLAPDGPEVQRCWITGKADNDLASLAAVIDEQDLQALVVQFNYGFFEFEAFGRFLEQQIDAGRAVIVMMHSTGDPPELAVGDPNWRLTTLAPALARCHRLVVHSLSDLNRLKGHGLSANAMLFPHPLWRVGPPEPQPAAAIRKTSPPHAPVIATFGYCLPHKGLPEVLEAVEQLTATGRRVKLLMLNAEYPVAVSAELVRQLRRRIDQLRGRVEVEMVSDYLDDETAAERLGSADLLVFAYQDTQESASGAVRHALATGRPVLVTPTPIFDELGEGVYRASGREPTALAQAMADALDHIGRDSERARAVAEAAARWRQAHDVDTLARRLRHVVESLTRESPGRLTLTFTGSSRWLKAPGAEVSGRTRSWRYASGILLYGPCIRLPAGRHAVSCRFELRNKSNSALRVRVVCQGGNAVLAETALGAADLSAGHQRVELPFTLDRPERDVEIQVESLQPLDLMVSEVSFGPGRSATGAGESALTHDQLSLPERLARSPGIAGAMG